MAHCSFYAYKYLKQLISIEKNGSNERAKESPLAYCATD
jgi:hypothetical protein